IRSFQCRPRTTVFFGDDGLAAQLDAVLLVDGDDFDPQVIADLANLVDVLDVSFGELADVAQSVFAGSDLDKRTEILDAADGAVVDLANLDLFGQSLDASHGGFGTGSG